MFLEGGSQDLPARRTNGAGGRVGPLKGGPGPRIRAIYGMQ
jgi:hypothetical protein